MSISIKKMLSESNGFTSGAFTQNNTGLAGNGWGLNTSTYFTATSVFNISLTRTNGIYLDLYDLIEMNPFEELNFLVDFSEISKFSNYFNCIQDSIDGSKIFIVPNSQKLNTDNFMDTFFLVPVNYENGNHSGTMVLEISYINTISTGFNNLDINYSTYDFKIPLQILVKEGFGDLTSKFRIKTLNSRPLSDYGLLESDLINNNHFNSDLLTLPDCKFILEYQDPILASFYTIKLNFKSKEEKPLPTTIPDIFVTISPKDAKFIDLKDYVTGETFNLECIKVSNLSKNGENYINLECVKNFITVIPYTPDIIDATTGLTESSEFISKIKYSTDKTSGVFNLHVLLDLNNQPRNLDTYKLLVPTVESKTIKVSNQDLTNGKNLNVMALIKNYLFPSKNPNNDTFRKVQLSKENLLPNLVINNVNGANIITTGDIDVPSEIKLFFTFSTLSTPIETKLKFISDQPSIEDFFKVSEMIINVSKNYTETVNILDYVLLEDQDYKYLDIDWTNSPSAYKNLNYPNGFNINASPTIYQKDNILDEVLSGVLILKLSNKFTDLNNKDSFGNIIGYRELPFKIICSSKNNGTDTGNILELKDIHMKLNDAQPILEVVNSDGILMGGLDYNDLQNDIVEISNVVVDPLTNVPYQLVFEGSPSILENKLIIGITTKKLWGIVYSHKSMLQVQDGQKIIINFDYKNKSGVVNSYTQTIYFHIL